MPNPASPSPSPTKPRGRWLKRILLTLLVLVAVGFFAGPPILAAIARPKIEALVAEQFNARAEIGSLSVSWSGAVRATDVKIVPPGDSPVLEIPSLEADTAVFAALGGSYETVVRIDQPVIRVRREPGGKTNLAHLLEKTATSAPAPPVAAQPLPPLKLDLKVTRGSVVFEDGAQSTRIENLEVTIDLPALDQPARCEASFGIAGGGTGKVVGRLTLLREGKLDPSGNVEYSLDAVALDKLTTAARLFSDLDALGGTLQAKGSYTIGHWPEISGSDEWSLRGLTAQGPSLGREPLSFPEISLKLKAAIDAQRVGKADLVLVSGKALDATAAVTFGAGESTQAVFKLNSNLKDLGEAIRGVLRMKEGVSLDGAMTADGTLVAAGNKGTLAANLSIDQLAAIDTQGKRTPIEKKVRVDADVAFDGDARSADIKKLTVDSSPVKASAHGTVTKETAQGTYELDADLDLLAQRLRAFMDLGDTALAGKLTASGEATTQNKSVHIKGKTVAENLHVGSLGPVALESLSDATLELGDEIKIDGAQRTTVAEAAYSGRTVRNVVLEARYKGTTERIDTCVLTGPGIKVDGSGTWSKLIARVDVDPGPFYRNLGILLGDLGLDGKPLTGEFTVASGEATTVQGKLESPELVLRDKIHRDVKVAVDLTLGQALEIRQARGSSTNGFFEVKGVLGGEKTDLKLDGEGDLGSIAILMATPPHWGVSGKATVKGTVTGAQDKYLLAIETGVPELEITRKWRSDQTQSSAGTARPVTIVSTGTVETGKELLLDLKHKVTVQEVVREGRSVRNLVADAAVRQRGDVIEALTVTGAGARIDGSGPLSAFRARIELDPGVFYKELAFLFGEFGMTGKPFTGEILVAAGKAWDFRGELASPEVTLSGRTYHDPRISFDLGLTEEILIRDFRLGAQGGSFTAKGTMGKKEAYEFSADGVLSDLAPDALPEGWEVPGKLEVGGAITGANDKYEATVEVLVTEILQRKDGSESVQVRMGPLKVLAGANLTFSAKPTSEYNARISLLEATRDGKTVKNLTVDARAVQEGTKYTSIVLTGPGFKLDGAGDPAVALAFKLVVDPPAIQTKMGSLLGDYALAGKPLQGTLDWSGKDEKTVKGALAGPEIVIRGNAHKDVKIVCDIGLGKVMAIRQARASASSGFLEAKGTWADEQADLTLDGAGDLAQLGGLLGVPKESKIAGKATLQGSLKGKDVLEAALGVEIGGFRVQHGGKTVDDPAVIVESQLLIDRNARTVKIARSELRSTFARGTVGGTVLWQETKPVAGGAAETVYELQDFVADLKYVPDRFGPVLGLFMPGELIGAEEQGLRIELAGKAKPAELKGLLAAKLDTYKYQGIALQGPVDGTLDGGILSLKAPLQSDNGAVDTIATVDLRPAKDKPKSFFLTDASGVAINEQTSKLLMRVHPLFHLVEGQGRLNGTAEMNFDLTWDGALPPEGDAVKAADRALTGKGKMLVKDLTLTGSMFLGQILEFLGEGDASKPGEMTCEKMEFQAGAGPKQEGRVAYENFRVFMQGMEMTFAGYVYYNQRLDMEMTLPITKKLGASNPGLNKFLGKGLKVPVTGTVASPSFDIPGAIANVVKEGLLDKAGGFFKDIFGGGGDEEEKK